MKRCVLCAGLWLAIIVFGGARAEARDLRIIGGREVDPAFKYPWMVGLLSTSSDTEYDGLFCGGALIAPDIVLTAAHCLEGETVENFDVLVGAHELDNSAENPDVRDRISPAAFLIHENFFQNEKNISFNDIGLIQLSRPVDDSLSGISLADDPAMEAPERFATVMGWGDTIPGKWSTSPVLREVDLPLVSQDTCVAAYPEDEITEAVICAGFADGGKDGCQGDSGGPLVSFNSGEDQHELIGLVSWGDGCAEPGKYGVYTRISAYRDWIDEQSQSVQTYERSEVVRNTEPAVLGDPDPWILRIEVDVTHLLLPSPSATRFELNTSGTTEAADIAAARLYYTGSSANFSTNPLFGSRLFGDPVSAPEGAFAIDGMQTLSPGKHYFWLVYELSPSAAHGRFLGAECAGILVDGVSRVPDRVDPEGTRNILSPHWGGGTSQEGGYYFANSTLLAADAPSQPAYRWITERSNEIAAEDWQGACDSCDPKNEGYVRVDLGFDFPFFGTDYADVYISTNGYLKFGAPPVETYGFIDIPGVDGEENVVAPMAADFEISDEQAAVYYGGDDRSFRVAFHEITTPRGLIVGETATFQVVLHSDGRIVFQYENIGQSILRDGVVGIENADGTAAIRYAGATIHDGLPVAVAFGPDPTAFGPSDLMNLVEILRILAGLPASQPWNAMELDRTGNGVVDMPDAVWTLQRLAGFRE
jgi:secreted trypsin-like serine protease